MKLDSIIFDLDGTLWDSTSSVIDSWNKTISGYEEVTNTLSVEDMRGIMGLVIEDVALAFFPYLEPENRLDIVNHCCEKECEHLELNGAVLYEQLEDTLKILVKKYRLFIVSNCQSGYIEAFFKSHKLDKYFVDYESSGRTGLGKGENIKSIINRNNLKNTIYVGDTSGDKKASIEAGIPFIYSSYGFGEVDGCDYVIDSFKDILGVILEE